MKINRGGRSHYLDYSGLRMCIYSIKNVLLGIMHGDRKKDKTFLLNSISLIF